MDLIELNPWWENKSLIDEDKHIKDLNSLEYVHRPKFLDKKFYADSIYTIRGPRQVGKTTAIKMIVRENLDEINPKRIFYWSCDNLNGRNDLIELLKEYSEYCNVNGVSPKYVFIDEITYLDNWQKAIKFVVDNGFLKGACFILTGSNIIDLKKGTERLPGRRGKKGEDIFHMPLKFREYVELIEPDFYEKHKSDSLEKLKFHSRKLKGLFEKFLKTGGIPLVINEYEKYGRVPNYIYELYYSWIIGDIFKEGKNEQTLRELMKAVISSYGTPVSWEGLAKESSIKSHLTVNSYVDLLSNLLVLFPVFFKDVGQDKIIYRKNKKIYFYDPFILEIFMHKLNIDVNDSLIVESLVGSQIKQNSILEETCFTQLKTETDFVVGNKGIEVKYQNKIKKEDFKNKRHFKKYFVLSKNERGENIIPVHLYLFSKV